MKGHLGLDFNSGRIQYYTFLPIGSLQLLSLVQIFNPIFVPLVTIDPACRVFMSTSPVGSILYQKSAVPSFGATSIHFSSVPFSLRHRRNSHRLSCFCRIIPGNTVVPPSQSAERYTKKEESRFPECRRDGKLSGSQS